MREIKFRAKSLKTGAWIYGDIAYQGFDTAYYIHESWDIAPCMSEPGGSVHYQTHEVDPQTIGEWAGFKDKDQKDIYEDDVIQPSAYSKVNWLMGRVVFKEGAFMVKGKNYTQGAYLSSVIKRATKAGNDMFIKGNIHDNPNIQA